jgi:hypothetical protein
MGDLEILYPAGKDVPVGGETLTVKPIKFGQLPQAARLIAPISKQIAAAFKAQDARTVADTAAIFIELMATGGDDLLVALGFFVGKPREWFDTLDNDEGLALLNAVFEVNADFFSRRVLPLFAQATPADPQDGATSLESSAQADTAEPTSTATP